MDTKKKILEQALTLFSEKGYGNVRVAQIAEAVGIKAPSLYKHYKSKQDIFQAILDEMKNRYDRQASSLHMNGSNALADVAVFSAVSEDELVQMGMALFVYFLHDPYTQKFRKMLTLEQYADPALAQLFSAQYADGPLSYQTAMFKKLCEKGVLKNADPQVMALQFYAPMYLLLNVCDRQPRREAEITALLEQHIRQFCKIYSKECQA